ncbi:MAG: class I tRNA ligase family protein, partial [Pseudomonadota bacterium]|nr:class I tRNA ligase family protein [Pseudomonadota bacterium]
LHPFMPFVTEELWAKSATRDGYLMLDYWPNLSENLVDAEATNEIGWLIGVITEIRSIRAEMNVPAGAQVPLVAIDAGPQTETRLMATGDTLKRLARLSDISFADTVPSGSAQTVLGEAVFALPLADVIDIGSERARLQKEIGKLEGEIKKLANKLSNEVFLAKAPKDVVAENRARLSKEEARRDKLNSALARLA